MPRVRNSACDGYCNSTWASCSRVSLRSGPSAKAPVAAVVDSGLRVSVLEGQMHTLSPGVVVVRRAFSYVETLDGPDDSYNPPNPKRWRFTPGDTIYIVDAEGDGDSYVNFVWTYRGREATTAKFWSDLR